MLLRCEATAEAAAEAVLQTASYLEKEKRLSEIIKKLTSVVNHAVFPVMEFKEIIIIFDLTYLSDALLKSLDPVVLSPDYEILFLQFFFLSSTKYSEFSIFFKTGGWRGDCCT